MDVSQVVLLNFMYHCNSKKKETCLLLKFKLLLMSINLFFFNKAVYLFLQDDCSEIYE